MLSRTISSLNEPSEKVSETAPEGLPELHSLTVDSGELYVAGGRAANYRLDKFNASSGKFVSQFAQVPSLTFLYQGVAVGHATGEQEVYVGGDLAGTEEGVVAAFDAAGSFQPPPWQGTDTPSGAFGCFECRGAASVAVDNSGLSSAAGDVYVADLEHAVVDVFEPEAGGSEKYLTRLEGPEPGVPFKRPVSLAVSAVNGDVLVEDDRPESEEGPAETVIDVFESAGLPGVYNFVRKIPLAGGGPLAVDGASGNIYVVQANGVDEFNATGELLDRLTGTSGGHPFSEVRSVAVDQASHYIYVGDFDAEEKIGSVDVFGPGLVVPDVKVTEPVSSLTPTGATLHGTVNPNEAGEATCEFEYGTSMSYGQHANCTAPVPNVNAEEPVESVSITGLSPDTTYHYRLDASNESGTNTGECPEDCGQFTTPGPGIRSESVSNLASTSVTFDASIDPHNAPTTYYFQYGPGTGYGHDVPLLTASEPRGAVVGSGEGDVEVSQHVQVGLAPGTTYHYRVVAVSEPKTGEFEEFGGPDQTFTTQSAESGLVLPDGRAWEMVSPPDKHGALILPIEEGAVAQASVAGSAMTYVATAATETEPQGYVNKMQVLSTRGGSSWVSRDIETPFTKPTGYSLTSGDYYFFSDDLSLGAIQPLGAFNPSLSPEASEQTPFLRATFLGGNVSEPCLPPIMHCYRPLVTGALGYENVPPGTAFGGEPEGGCLATECGPEFVGATPDLSHAVVKSDVALSSTPGDEGGLYEWAAGKLALISMLPGEGGPASKASKPNPYRARHGISGDGSRVVWRTGEPNSSGHLYVRDTPRGETVQLDAAQPEASGANSAEPRFQLASSDGSKVFFTDTQRLTKDAGAHDGSGQRDDLYECEMVVEEGELGCRLTDLTPLGPGGSADVQGAVLGASEDASLLYFVADGVFAPGAVRGAPNLYVRHGGVTGLVAVLGADSPDWGRGDPANLGGLTARVSPDGRWLAFMSQRSLTGYDNRDANSGRADEEVYLYHAPTAGGEGALTCPSCNPSGARPVGVESGDLGNGIGSLAGGGGVWEKTDWLAANIPGWTPARLGRVFYQSRYLSDSGRLFFNSHDALVPQDVNGNEDVYEYEPPGVGGCSASVATFSERSGGCVGLISAGTSSEESAFLDASENGGDVFFLTAAKLLPQDSDTSLDVYDAHECTGVSPCFPVPPESPPSCGTEASCKAAPSPQPGIFGAPSSATFSGAGNVSPPPPVKGSKTVAQVRAERLARALRLCRRDRSRRKRVVCERRARRAFGAARKVKRSHRGGR